MSTITKTEEKGKSVVFYLLLAAALFIFIESFSLLSPILLSFLLIFLISLALNPMIYRMRSWTGGRKTATVLMAASILIALSLVVWAFIGPLKNITTTVVTKLPAYIDRLQMTGLGGASTNASTNSSGSTHATNSAAGTPTNATPSGGARPPAQTNATAARSSSSPPPSAASKPGGDGRSAWSGTMQILEGAASGFKAMALNASQILVVLITVFFGVTFTLMNPRPIFSAVFGMVPERHHSLTLTILHRMSGFLPTWALATLVAMFTVGSLVFFLMWPFFGFSDAAVLGLVAMVFEAVPYLGPLLSAIPAVFFALGKGGMTPVWVCLLYLAVQLLENNLIIPVIMARGMKLHPVAVMFSILLCVETFGILGVVVAAPMVAIAQILHDEIYRKRFLPHTTDAELHQLGQSVLRGQEAAIKKAG